MFGNRELKRRISELEDNNDVLRENTRVVRQERDDLRDRISSSRI